MKAILVLLLLSVSARADFSILCNSTTRVIESVATDDPQPATTEYKRAITADEYAQKLANRGAALMVDDPSGIRPATEDEILRALPLPDALYRIFSGQTDAVKAAFLDVWPAIKLALEMGQVNAAKLRLQSVDVSSQAQSVQDAKAKMLSLFP